MVGKQTHLYSLPEDLTPILEEVMTYKKFKVFSTEPSSSPAPVEITGLKNDLSENMFLIVPFGVLPRKEGAKQRRSGDILYFMGQGRNPQSIILRTSRFFDNKKTPFERRLLPGTVGTISDHPESMELYKFFAKSIRKRFEKIQEYYVGPSAAAALDSGIRLTATEGSPVDNDLVRLLPKRQP